MALRSVSIDKNGDVVAASDFGISIVKRDSAGWRTIVLDSVPILVLHTPVMNNGDLFWIATPGGDSVRPRVVKKWDGQSVSALCSLSRSAYVTGVMASENRVDIFTSEYIPFERMTYLRTRIINGVEVKRDAVIADSCSFYHFFRLKDRYFTFGYHYKRSSTFSGKNFIGEILGNDSLVMLDSLSFTPDDALIAGDALYLYYYTGFYKMTQDGISTIPLESDHYERGFLFLDSDKCPALFFPGARKVLRIDPFPGEHWRTSW
jgi:hypothetical protein